MKNKNLMLCGILAPIVYVSVVLAGGFLWQGYSHIVQPVSDLIARESPNKSTLDPFFAIYNILTISFGFGIFQYVRADTRNRNKMAGTIGALTLVAEGIFGIFDIIYPEDAAGGIAETISSTGMLHIVFAGLCSLATMAAILLMGFWFKESASLRWYGKYSFISVAIIFLTGGMTAISISSQNGLGGLFERITMGAWLQWLFFVGLKMYSRVSYEILEGTNEQ